MSEPFNSTLSRWYRSISSSPGRMAVAILFLLGIIALVLLAVRFVSLQNRSLALLNWLNLLLIPLVLIIAAVWLTGAWRRTQLEVARLRGRSSLPEVVQAAQHHARLRFGSDGIDDFAPLEVSPDADETDVTLAGPDSPVVVRIAESRSEPIFTMCLARNAGPVRQFRLVSISAVQHP